jgi:hypothetical protein
LIEQNTGKLEIYYILILIIKYCLAFLNS